MSFKKYFLEIFEKNPKQDPVIDAIRALSVLSIIVFHIVVGITHVYDAQKAKDYILAMPSALQPLWHGEKGVDAFFLISALVLGIPLFKKLENFDASTAMTFYKKRLFRIYPLFLVALSLYTIGQWSYFGKYFFSNLFFVNNLIDGERAIIPVGWSLVVEMQYYVFLPALFFLLKKTKHRIFVLCGLIFASIAACAIVLIKNPELYQRPLTDLFLAADKDKFANKMGGLFYEANLTRFGPFIIGLLLAYLKVFHEEKLKALFSRKTIGATAFVLAGVFILLPITIPLYHPESWYYRNFFSNINLIVMAASRQMFAMGLCILVLGCWYSETYFAWIKRVFNFRLWLPFSRLSFPIYLFHFPFIAVAASVVFQTTNIKDVVEITFFNGVGIFILACTLTLLFSIPLYIVVERPFIERGKTEKTRP